tara:strand:+ start:173 stop:718 length:546 start_codon:yes stop_codon:yes gene_type:complete
VTNTSSKATFAGGCFWCMEPPFSEQAGVLSVLPGYTGGHVDNPSYEAVITGKTGHLEAIQITFDDTRVSYNTLLAIFWKQIDPTDDGGQFADRGDQYKTAIFYHSQEQKNAAIQSKQRLDTSKKFKKPIVTAIKEASIFFIAEEYHQKFYKKNPEYYQRYKVGSGRDAFIQNVWKSDKTQE